MNLLPLSLDFMCFICHSCYCMAFSLVVTLNGTPPLVEQIEYSPLSALCCHWVTFGAYIYDFSWIIDLLLLSEKDNPRSNVRKLIRCRNLAFSIRVLGIDQRYYFAHFCMKMKNLTFTS